MIYLAKEHGTLHHIIPTSIGGPNESWNIYSDWPSGIHESFHEIFKNFIPSTCIAIIESWPGENGKIDKKKMGEKKWEAWQKAFDHQSPKEVIKFIEENFLPAEKIFLSQSKKPKNRALFINYQTKKLLNYSSGIFASFGIYFDNIAFLNK